MNVYLADYGCSLFFHAGKVANVHSATNIQGLHAAMPADGHVAILISHTGKNERLAEIAGMLRKGGTKVIVISAVRDGIVSKQADEFLYAAGSEKVRRVLEFNVLCFGKISVWISYIGMEFSRKYDENLAIE